MSEMVDRVERAIDEAMTGHVRINPYSRDDVAQARIGLHKAARAAIAAMSEPTEAMVDALSRRIVADEGTVEMWRATVAVALAE